MEVICELDLHIWNLFFGLSGMLNDINKMLMGPNIENIINGTFPRNDVTFSADRRDFSLMLLSHRRYLPEFKYITK